MEKLFVFGDFNWLQEPEFIGELCYEKLRGSDSYAFKFDNDWLNLHAGIKLSEDINNYPGMQYTLPGNDIFGCFADALPDRWGRTLLKRREQLQAEEEKRAPRNLSSFDYLVGIDDFSRMGCFRFKKEKNGVSVGVRGPVSIHQALSLSPVEVESLQITKSVNGEPGEKRASDTMGMKHFVRFGLYEIKGSINVQLAEKTGFSQEDAQVVKECLRTLFVNDASSARPEGSMEVVKLYWWEHNCKDGQYSSAKVHRSVHVTAKDIAALPNSVEDYTITLDELPGLMPEIIEGV